MRMNRWMLVGLFALAAAGGILGANGYFQRLGETENGYKSLNRTASNWPPAEHFPSAPEKNWPSAFPPDDFGTAQQKPEPRRRYFPHPTQSIEMAQADDRANKPAAAGKPIFQNEPGPLPIPHRAAPLATPQSANWLKEIIAQELPEATDEEQRVWSEELRGLSPEMVRDILRMRNDLTPGPLSPRLGAKSPTGPLTAPLFPPPADELPMNVHSVASRLEPSLAAVEQARDVILNNLANANTIGFKRSRVIMEPLPYQTLQAGVSEKEAAGPGTSMGLGVVLSETPIDASQGTIQKTNQPLDVAIEGTGFFQIEADGDMFYTRSGHLSFNDEGGLCLLSGGKLRPLAPRILVPADSVSVMIGEDGRVTTLKPAEEGELTVYNAGRIELARFRNPSALKPVGGHLFAAGKAAGIPITGHPQGPGFGLLRQGSLELSNVSRDEELEQFQTLQNQWQLLRHLSGLPSDYPGNGPIARRPQVPAKRTSAPSRAVPFPSLEPLKALRDRGGSLIDEYLQSERAKSIRRTFGLE